MTAYIANHQKKLTILHKREQELIHALKHGYTQEKLEKAAEKLRTAKLAVFKAKFAKKSELPPSSYISSPAALAWETMPISAILEKYEKASVAHETISKL